MSRKLRVPLRRPQKNAPSRSDYLKFTVSEKKLKFFFDAVNFFGSVEHVVCIFINWSISNNKINYRVSLSRFDLITKFWILHKEREERERDEPQLFKKIQLIKKLIIFILISGYRRFPDVRQRQQQLNGTEKYFFLRLAVFLVAWNLTDWPCKTPSFIGLIFIPSIVTLLYNQFQQNIRTNKQMRLLNYFSKRVQGTQFFFLHTMLECFIIYLGNFRLTELINK